jgi:hypothetical protein
MSDLTRVAATKARTLVISSVLDTRTVATLADWWLEQGEHVRSISELVRLSLEVFGDLLVKNGAKSFETIEDGEKVLIRMGIATKAMTTKNQTNRAIEKVNFELERGGYDHLLGTNPRAVSKGSQVVVDIEQEMMKVQSPPHKVQEPVDQVVRSQAKEKEEIEGLGQIPTSEKRT